MRSKKEKILSVMERTLMGRYPFSEDREEEESEEKEELIMGEKK